jgi:hypothetical protein
MTHVLAMEGGRIGHLRTNFRRVYLRNHAEKRIEEIWRNEEDGDGSNNPASFLLFSVSENYGHETLNTEG